MTKTPAHVFDVVRSLISNLNCLCEIGTVEEMAPLGNAEFKLEVADRNTVWAASGTQIYPKSEITIKGTDNIVLFGEKSNLSGSRLEISGRDNILVVGPHVKMRNKHIKIAARQSLVVIGAGTTFVGGAILCESDEQHVVIGSDCMFAAQVVVRTDDGHTIFDRSSHALLNAPRSVVVHSHVWLGNAVRVNKGAVIGTGAVIAQGSIVSGSVESHCIYGGVPAKKLREGVVWSRSASYNDIPLIFR